jgi:hypothetical protein
VAWRHWLLVGLTEHYLLIICEQLLHNLCHMVITLQLRASLPLEGKTRAELERCSTEADKQRWRMCKHLSNLISLRERVQTFEVATSQVWRQTHKLVKLSGPVAKFRPEIFAIFVLDQPADEVMDDAATFVTIRVAREMFDRVRVFSHDLEELCDAVTTCGVQDALSHPDFYKTYDTCSTLDMGAYLDQQRRRGRPPGRET